MRFQPGVSGNAAGRPKGALNKTTAVLREAVIQAAQNVGEDGQGKGGVVGYLTTLAKIEPKAFAALLGRAMPLQVEGTGADGALTFQRIVVEVVEASERKALTGPDA